MTLAQARRILDAAHQAAGARSGGTAAEDGEIAAVALGGVRID